MIWDWFQIGTCTASRLFEHIQVLHKVLQCSTDSRIQRSLHNKFHHEHHSSFVQVGPLVSLPTAEPAGRCTNNDTRGANASWAYSRMTAQPVADVAWCFPTVSGFGQPDPLDLICRVQSPTRSYPMVFLAATFSDVHFVFPHGPLG